MRASSYEVKKTKQKGQGLFATQFIEEGKNICIISEDKCITCDILNDFYQFFEIFYLELVSIKVLFSYFLAALTVIYPHHREEHQYIVQYLNSLPKEAHALVNWNLKELQDLHNPQLIERVCRKRQGIKQAYKKIKDAVQKVWRQPIQKNQYRLFQNWQQINQVEEQQVVKFYSFLQSRGVYYQCQKDSSGQVGALVPVIDKLNHSENPNCRVQISFACSIISERSIQIGQEILVSYGKFTREHFLQFYGFMVQWNQPQPPQSGSYRRKLAEFYDKQRQKQMSQST